MEKNYSRKLRCQYLVTAAVLIIVGIYMWQANTIDANVITFAIIAVGGSGATMMASNAIGDHGALKKG